MLTRTEVQSSDKATKTNVPIRELTVEKRITIDQGQKQVNQIDD